MLVRPSLILQVGLSSEDYSLESAEEIKRSYIYLAQSIVKENPAEASDDGNVMRLSIRLMRPYWETDNPSACALWDGVMPQWLRNVTRNVSVAMHNYNEVDHPIGCGKIVYDWADYDFGGHVIIRVKVDAENRITSQMPAIVERVRQLMNDGAFGEKQVALVRVPSRQNYDRQLEEAIKAAEESEERERLAAESGGESGVEGGDGADGRNEKTFEATDDVAAKEPVVDFDSEQMEDACEDSPENECAEVAQQGEEIPAGSEDRPISFDIDYGVWGIEYADGTIEEFDSRA